MRRLMATHHHPLLTKKLPPPPTTLNSWPPLFFPSLRLVSPMSSHRRCLSTTTVLVSSSNRDDNGTVNQDSKKVLLKGMRYAELEKWVQSHGFRPGQALMLWKRLYGNDIWAHCIDELEGLNKDFKKMLSEHAEFRALFMKDILTASDGTRKILFTLEDGLVIETVVIPCNRDRTTVCVSSQVGCAMNCQFCYTGRMGLRRNLTAGEIVEQAVFARRLLSAEVGSITNVVFMVGLHFKDFEFP
ncbi:hypothetical protein CsSME_00021846 [Camellia sinensis var. sinensis]